MHLCSYGVAMWIKTQDSSCLINTDNISVIKIDGNQIKCFEAGYDNPITIGKYDSKKSAQKIFDAIDVLLAGQHATINGGKK